ncbi:glycosyltransferase [Paraflavitalea soli]|uniref:Glycosyltransferase n=1 Tax=Paraflavitalea soli TaxID=2315862 RepID=A0A3B7MZ31_9BACT|nr:glycosyltransferase [Paraflavitalea soli]AXY75551.1 glycosyltransferase [Paraflavitalea soli]
MSENVCAVIVTWNRLETLKTALAHILAQTVKPAMILIADNNSTDGTREFLTTLKDQPNMGCLYLDTNVGSAGAIASAMKLGLGLADYDYFWILDDDTFYDKNALRELIDNIRNSPFDLLGLHGALIRFGKKRPLDPASKLQAADYALIDGALIKTAAIRQAGVVDEKFFMMCDDHEYCMRLKKHGFRIGVLQSGTDNRLYLGGQGRFTRATLWRGYYSSRNHLLIIRQYFSLVNLMGYVFLQVKLITAAALLAPDRFQRVKFRLVGIWHGIRGIGGKTLDPGTLKFRSVKQ